MNKNNLYFLKMWSKILIIGIPMVIFMVLPLFMSESMTEFKTNLKPVIFGMLMTLIFTTIIFRKNKTAIDRYFKNATSEQLLNYFHKIYKKKKMQDKDAMLAYTKSVVCCYYGEFDKAKELMKEINWEKRSPHIQSLEVSVRALLCYLESENYIEGLRLSIISQQLGKVSNKIPGSKKSREFYETYIQIGEILNGNIDDRIINDLEQQFDKFPIFVRLLMGFGLSKAYNQMEMSEKAKEKLDYCKKVAPYCEPLFKS